MHLVDTAEVTQLVPVATEPDVERWVERAVNAATEVHRTLGPGFVASVYEEALCLELATRAIPFRRRVPVTVGYKGKFIGHGEITLLVADRVAIEIETVDVAEQFRRRQLRSHLRAAACRLGLLLNFDVPQMTQGIRRIECDESLRDRR
jgi:GxxExxY protein